MWAKGEQTGWGIAYGHGGAGPGYKADALVSGDGARVAVLLVIAVLLLNGRAGARADRLATSTARHLYCAR